MSRPRRVSLILVLGAIVLLTSAGDALADSHGWGGSGSGSDCGVACAAATGVLIGILDAVYLTADIFYLARGQWLPPGWAWTQTLLGGGHVFVGVILTPIGILAEDGAVLGLGISFGVLGTWFFVHGVISLVKHYSHRARERRWGWLEQHAKYLPDVSVAPTQTGTFTGLSWRF